MAVNLVHYTLDKMLSGISAQTQRQLTQLSAAVAPLIFPFETKQITFDRHPLETLCHLLERSGPTRSLQEALNEVPETLRNALFFEVWSQAIDPNKGGEKWGEHNALANHERLLNAIKTVALTKLNTLPEEKKHLVYGTVYRMARHPRTEDLQWGEHHAASDLKRLICALHRSQSLGIPGKEIKVCAEIEKDLPIPSHFFHLSKPELPRGQIGFHNGMCNSPEDALIHATRISTECAQGYNIHCTYSATVNLPIDAASAFISQGGVITPPVLNLLELWLDFFESNEQDKKLEICHSRGAIEVYNALNELPASLRQRILVITVAPACLIPADLAYQVVNLIIENDAVVKIAANRQLLDAPHTKKLPLHNDTFDPHDMHGSSYREQLTAMIDTYIRTNQIL